MDVATEVFAVPLDPGLVKPLLHDGITPAKNGRSDLNEKIRRHLFVKDSVDGSNGKLLQSCFCKHECSEEITIENESITKSF